MQFYSSSQKHFSSRKPIFFGFIAGFLIVALSGVLLLALIANDASYEHLGSTHDVFDRSSYQEMAEVEFIIDNNVGTVSVDFLENDSDELVIIELEVYGSSGSSLEDSNMFEVQELGNRTLFMFNSWNPYTSDNFNYDIIIYVSKLLHASFDVQVITGGIMFFSEGPNTIEEISLETTTGSINANFLNTYFPLEDTVNKLKTVTGSIDTQFVNIVCEGDLYWNIDTVSGSIYTEIYQVDLPEGNVTYHLDLVAVTGEINYHFDFNNSARIGYYLDSKIVTGQTILSGFSTSIDIPHFSPNFDMATLNIVSIFETTTGSIRIVKG